MSEKTDFFDKIIDEKTVEKISEDYPVLSEEEKDRIFSLVERKLNIDKVENSDHSEEVSGVEEYIRPRWMNIISIAASAAVVFGGIGSSVCLMRNMKPSISDTPSPEVVDEAETSPTDTPFVSVQTSVAAEMKNDPVQKTTKAVEDQLAVKAVKTKDNKQSSNAVVAVSLDNNGAAASEQLNDIVTDAGTPEAENNEPQIIVQADVPVTTTVVTTEYEIIQTTAVQIKDENEKLVEVAECIIADYDNVKDIIDADLPVIEGSAISVTHRMVTPSGDGVYNRLIEYGQVDPDVYSDMQTLKEHFYSVMCSSMTEIFGPEFSSESSYEDIVVDRAYSYITYDGKLYRLMGNEKHELEPLPYEKAVVYNVSENAFTAKKNYIDLTDGSTVTVHFGVVRDYKANKWSLLNVTSD